MKRILSFLFGAMSILNVYSQDKLINANNDFAFKIYKATKPDTINFFISPFSLNVALSIANEGAKTTTRKELDNLLCIHDLLQRDYLYNDLIKTTTNLKDSDFFRCQEWSNVKSEGNALYLANSLWINNEFQIDNIFKQTIKEKYNSEVFTFGKSDINEANQNLNKWISEKTKNKINEISGLNKDIKLSIINAIYFMGEWDNPFEKKKTKKKNFHTIKKDKVKIDFMNDQSYYRYFEDDDIQSVFLNYKCNQFSMIVLLPQDRYGIDKIESKLNYNYLSNIEMASRSNEVILSLPKFKIETEISPKDEIIKMGYSEMFSDKADFTNMSADSLKINKITHKTFIEIDEKKTEAAAVSKVDLVVIGYGVGGDPPPPPAPKIFNANHPFVFLIVDNRTKAIIFIGRFVK
jgi:serpin B